MKIILPQFDKQLLKDIRASAKKYMVNYHLLNTDKDPAKITLKQIDKLTDKWSKESVCFTSIRGSIEKKYNTLVYCFTDENMADMAYLTTKEVRRWIRLCKYYRFIDKGISIKFGVKHPYVVIKFDSYTKNQLYVYLCSIRYLVEWPHYVRMVLAFYDNKLPFYSAFMAASRIVINNSVHHILPVLRCYGERFDKHVNIYNATIPLNILIGLKLFLLDPKKYDKKSVYNGSFSCERKLSDMHLSLRSLKTAITIKDLFTRELKLLINATDVETMKKCFDLYRHKLSNNEYKFVIPSDISQEAKYV